MKRATVPANYVRSVARLYGDRGDRMRHYATLSRDEQEAAIRQLARDGHADHTIAHATGLAVEQVRRILGVDRGGESR